MPKRTDISTILIIGAGPIVIGQACEFDYSGTQACKALKQEGYRLVLVNSNPATIMTDPDLADATYIEPITPEIVTRIIEKERNVVPGGFALLPTMGGQTALNCALSLRRMGTLEKYDVEMIGATADAIDKAEDRALFREAMTKIGLETPRSKLANASELKRQDRDKYKQQRAYIEGRDLSDAQRAQLLADFELDWRKQEIERRERYQDQALIEALQALDYVGLPGFGFLQDPIEYGTRTHHSNMDVYDRIQAADLEQMAVIEASFAYNAATRPDKLPRKDLPPPQPAGRGGGRGRGAAPTAGNQ